MKASNKYDTAVLEDLLSRPFSAQLLDLFKVSPMDLTKMDNALNAFIKVHSKFYFFFTELNKWIVITITFKRSGIVFYTAEELQGECHFEIGSVMSWMLVPVTINVNKLIDIMVPLHNANKAQLLQDFKARGFKYKDLSITIKY